jgi:hypothetical protein
MVGILERLLPHLNEGRPARTLTLSRRRESAAQAPLPADHQADDVRRQRRSKTASRTIRTSTACASTRPPKRRRWSPCAPRSKPNSPTSTTKTRRSSSPTSGSKNPGSNRLIRAAYQLLGLQTYFTAGPRKCGPGPSTSATPRRRPPASSTPTSKAASSARRPSRFADFIACKGEQGAKEAGKMRAEGKEYVVKDGDVLNFLFNV